MTVAAAAPEAPLRVALVGSPNSGKTTLFNALTGARAKTANFPGVTVERREGRLTGTPRRVAVLDLPGTYSMRAETPDERVVDDVLNGQLAGEELPDALLLVVDGTTLRRSLGLVTQVLQRRIPTVLVVTMIDEVRARSGELDLDLLGRILGIPVLGVVGHRGIGLEELSRALERPEGWSRPSILRALWAAVERQ